MIFVVFALSYSPVAARFDVRRSDQEKYTVATVVKVDFSGSLKRVFFHFLRSVSDRDEWVPLGSDRIAPLHSRSSKGVPKAKGKQAPRKKLGQDRKDHSVDPSVLAHFVVGGKSKSKLERSRELTMQTQHVSMSFGKQKRGTTPRSSNQWTLQSQLHEFCSVSCGQARTVMSGLSLVRLGFSSTERSHKRDWKNEKKSKSRIPRRQKSACRLLHWKYPKRC